MIEFFPSIVSANVFLSLHPEWKPVSVSAGHLSGSILVLFEPAPHTVWKYDPTQYKWNLRHEEQPVVPEDCNCDSMEDRIMREPTGRRRGRPPKVKNA